MPENEDQHFVPKMYFRLFVKDKKDLNDVSIRMFNKKSKINQVVAYLSQCQKDNFYSKNPIVDKIFSKMESIWAIILNDIVEKESLEHLSEEDKFHLRTFVLFQNGRTLKAKNSAEDASEAFQKQILEAEIMWGSNMPKEIKLSDLDKITITDSGAHMQSLVDFVMGAPLLEDLQALLVINETNQDFIFSDAPVIFYNQWLRREKGSGTTGFQTSGLQIFCPIGPRHLLIYFDPNTYKLNFRTNPLHLFKKQDVNRLNDLQIHHSLNNIYSTPHDDNTYVPKRFTELGEPNYELRTITERGPVRETNDEISRIAITSQENLKYELALRLMEPIGDPSTYIPGIPRSPTLVKRYLATVEKMEEEARSKSQNSNSE